jgi:tryptophanyl-tRNA synthetase
MSKSYGNGVDLSEDEKSLAKKVKAMPTDPARVRREDKGDPQKCNVYTYHKLFSSEADLEWVASGCVSAGIGCGDCKMRLIENMNSLMKNPREKKKELLNNQNHLDSIIEEGCKKARRVAQSNLHKIKEMMKMT